MPRTALVLTLLLTLSLAACGGTGAAGGGDAAERLTPAALVAKSITATREAKSYRMDFQMSADIGPVKEHFTLDGGGVSSADSYRGTFDGTIKLGRDKPMKTEFIVVGKELWMQTPDFRKVMPKGKVWVHMTDDKMLSRSMTPAEYLDFLKSSDDIREVGREDVRGNPSIHLRGPLDLRGIAKETSSEAARMLSRLPNVDRFRADVDVWVSERDDRMTRSAVRVSGKDFKGSIAFTSDILEWDPPLDAAEPPPKAKVIELSELGKG